jgi:hypothetical protein
VDLDVLVGMPEFVVEEEAKRFLQRQKSAGNLFVEGDGGGPRETRRPRRHDQTTGKTT